MIRVCQVETMTTRLAHTHHSSDGRAGDCKMIIHIGIPRSLVRIQLVRVKSACKQKEFYFKKIAKG